ncbi:hypothetical protein LQ567_12200 [Niabella pedocola]|uniref:F5/8 type C domain-containing protein n=1 Tax=Niabella pedocola TaxID=1752077 RepID=A0ABS8PRU5_9BACT|nr:hypothetical protein [Niabella pedocola]MCD2423529.1 hypothetical protein [Niabella pedocola]
MKKIYLLFTALVVFMTTAAQTILVSGGCIESPVTLTVAPESPIGGKTAYSGTGTIAGKATPISIYWIGAPDNVWALAYDGQPYYSCPKDTPLPPGTSSFSWTAVTPAPCPSPAALTVAGNVALWVTFGSITANLRGHQLSLHWEALTEVNNDHFEIEASKDGSEFTEIATVQSKAENGNSDATITYDWNSGGVISLAALTGIFLLVLLMLCSKRNKMMLAGAWLILLVAPNCTKTKDIDSKDKPQYIRIAHVAKDGVKLYSRIVKIVEE